MCALIYIGPWTSDYHGDLSGNNMCTLILWMSVLIIKVSYFMVSEFHYTIVSFLCVMPSNAKYCIGVVHVGRFIVYGFVIEQIVLFSLFFFLRYSISSSEFCQLW